MEYDNGLICYINGDAFFETGFKPDGWGFYPYYSEDDFSDCSDCDTHTEEKVKEECDGRPWVYDFETTLAMAREEYEREFNLNKRWFAKPPTENSEHYQLYQRYKAEQEALKARVQELEEMGKEMEEANLQKE